ncbi:hypothetical protein ABEB36_014019 [Hypothenemus hampei]|uniref:Uncharacterized protein n=1 Tax=Hypothenemus hampei TaxID=57062 RepID=A0ABD1E389_HYPHA
MGKNLRKNFSTGNYKMSFYKIKDCQKLSLTFVYPYYPYYPYIKGFFIRMYATHVQPL